MNVAPLTPGAHAEKNQLATNQPWVWLYEIEVPTSPPTRYRLARYASDVTFRGHTYSSFPITHGTETLDTDGSLPETTLQASNVSRELISTLESYQGLIGQPVRILLVNIRDLASGVAASEQDWTIRRVSFTEEAVTANLSLYNLFRTRFPAKRMARNACRFTYRGVECGYTLAVADGGLASCDFTLDGPNGCQVHGTSESDAGVTVQHPNRFGGAPGIPRPITGGGL